MHLMLLLGLDKKGDLVSVRTSQRCEKGASFPQMVRTRGWRGGGQRMLNGAFHVYRRVRKRNRC